MSGDRRDEFIPSGPDLAEAEAGDLARLIETAASDRDLAEVYASLDGLIVRLAGEGADIEDLGRLAAGLRDRILSRSLDLLLSRLPLPPGPWCLAVLGSEGRQEQYLGTDQDNGLIQARAAGPDVLAAPGIPPGQDGGWYADMAAALGDSLAAIGFPPCPRRIMAGNPEWRMSLEAWSAEITDMAARLDERAVLRLSILADLRPVAGEARLAGELRQHLGSRLRAAPMALKYLAREALRFAPPIGIFNNLLTDDHGALDLKKGGLFPIVQGAKVLALDGGDDALRTSERLAGLARRGVLSRAMTEGLRQAYRLFQSLRLRGQISDLRAGRRPGQEVRPDGLAGFERKDLKAALRLTADFQDVLDNRYGLRLLT